MATDFNSSLPVRTESPGDVKSQIVGVNTANTLVVNADGSINTNVAATDFDIRNLSAATDLVTAYLKDEAGNAFSESNPLPVTLVDSEGDEIHDYFETATTVAAGSNDTHIYTVPAGKTLKFEQAIFAGSAKAKFVVEIALDGSTYVIKSTRFNSTSEPDADVTFKRAISVPAGGKVKITRHNRDQQPQALYSTIVGVNV